MWDGIGGDSGGRRGLTAGQGLGLTVEVQWWEKVELTLAVQQPQQPTNFSFPRKNDCTYDLALKPMSHTLQSR